MQFQLISDVHIEFHRDCGKYFSESIPVLSPTLIIAGDFATHQYIKRNISVLVKRFENVIYVCGNHEYYGATRGMVNQSLTKLKNRYKNFHWLNNSFVELEGIRFLGATLWYKNYPDNVLYENLLNDGYQIRGFKKWVYKENAKSVEFFSKNLRKGDVAITHHAPSTLSINENFKNNITNRFYVCDMSEVIYQTNPSYWLHGHMHKPVSYTLYNTRVESNPFGYVGHESTPAPSMYFKKLEI